MEQSSLIKLLAGFLVLAMLVQGSLGHCDEKLCNSYGCVRMYEHKYHRGRDSCYYPRRNRCTNLEDLNWNPSSLRIRNGCVTLWTEKDCRGFRKQMDVGYEYENDLEQADFDDRAQSISSC